MTEAGVLYNCRVMHRRPGPPRYRFDYRAFYLLLDIDRIDPVFSNLRFMSRNRFNLMSFYDRDHGPHDGSDLRIWVEGLLAERGVRLDGGCIRLLCMPRVLGYVFNPVGFYYCEHADGGLRAIVAEVRNTFGERHCYVLDAGGAPMEYGTAHAKEKLFHVSPLLERAGRYRFRFTPPGARFGVGIRLYADGAAEPRVAAALTGTRRALTDRNLLRLFLRIPLQTVKVALAIHWQALKIWLRGAVFHRKPPQRYPNVS